MSERILAYEPKRYLEPSWWEFWVGIYRARIPDDVKRQLAIARVAHAIATQLATLEPEANREILGQAAAILGVRP